MDQTLLPFVMDDNRTYEKTGVYKVLIASGQSDLEKLQCTVQLTMFADGSVRPPLPIFCLHRVVDKSCREKNNEIKE